MSSTESCKQKKRPRIDRIAQMRRESRERPNSFMIGRERNRENRIVEAEWYIRQRPHLFISVGGAEIFDSALIRAFRRDPTCDGMLIIFDPIDEEDAEKREEVE